MNKRSYRLRFGYQSQHMLLRHVKLTLDQAQSLSSTITALIDYLGTEAVYERGCEEESLHEISSPELVELLRHIGRAREVFTNSIEDKGSI